MRLPRDVWDKLNRVRSHFPKDRALTPKEIGLIFNRTAADYPTRGPGAVGMQRKDAGGMHSVLPNGTTIWNGLRFVDDAGNHWGVDCCGACSVGRFDPIDADAGPADESSFVAAVNEDGIVPNPDPVTPPPPTGEVSALRAEVAGLAARMDTEGASGGIEAKWVRDKFDEVDKSIADGAAGGDETEGTAHKGDAVTVRTKIFGQNVTSKGTIDK